MENCYSFGDKLKQVRIQHGLTQKALGKLCNMSQQQIAQYESGKLKPKFETVQRICEAMNDDVLLFAFRPDYLVPWSLIDLVHENFYKDYESQLLDFFSSLNQKGKEAAIQRIKELSLIPEYTKKDTTDIDQDTEAPDQQ